MSHFLHRGLPRAPLTAAGAESGSGSTGQDRLLVEKATRMHMLSRLRGRHFFAPVMADSAMDVMLSLFVGELQSSPVSDTAIAVGNLLTREDTQAIIDRLVQADLAYEAGAEPDRRIIALTPLGSARMRSYVSDYPDV